MLFRSLAERDGVEVRFIEHMPMDADRVSKWRVDPREVLRNLARDRALEPLPTDPHGGPAERYRIGGAAIGFIHAMSNPFCDRCNRLRITAEGRIRSCLLSGGEVDLVAPLRSDLPAAAADDEIERLLREAAAAKPPIFDLQRDGAIAMRSSGG